MYCNQCGGFNPSGSRYCSSCGRPLPPAPGPRPPQAPSMPQPMRPVQGRPAPQPTLTPVTASRFAPAAPRRISKRKWRWGEALLLFISVVMLVQLLPSSVFSLWGTEKIGLSEILQILYIPLYSALICLGILHAVMPMKKRGLDTAMCILICVLVFCVLIMCLADMVLEEIQLFAILSNLSSALYLLCVCGLYMAGVIGCRRQIKR